ncbi:hypothetical protein HAX54_009219 [Datura stramonium]|uniref:Transcription repressor n=1 Tax=Datura stramonium TaxID=4076 RepID=A0ABS8RIB5_DATST|nr:hypothetical protein [Datura stramonium]
MKYYFSLWSSTVKRFSYLRKNKKIRKYDECANNMFGVFPESSSTIPDHPEEALEMARQALTSRRLSFEEDDSCSVLSMAGFPFKDCLVLAVETEDPKMDFLHSMEQMTKAYGGEMVDWEFMEELLTWFLRINNMKNQHFIVAAFLDLCLGSVETTEPLIATEVPVETVVEAVDGNDEIVHVAEEFLEELDADCGASVHIAEPSNSSMLKKGMHFKEEYSCRIM